MMSGVRSAAVAGTFYPARRSQLEQTLRTLLDGARSDVATVRAIIAPHAGYIYSGAVAASAYRALQAHGDGAARIVLLGPSHRLRFDGIATSSARWFETPLGAVEVDRGASAALARRLAQVRVLDAAHELEHSLEVHLPFLQTQFEQLTIVPLLVGDAAPAEVAQALEPFWDAADTRIVVSSDLSHYQDYQTACALDAATSRQIESRDPSLSSRQACGWRAINGLLDIAVAHDATVTTLDLKNSGDSAGDRQRVVGYGAYALASA